MAHGLLRGGPKETNCRQLPRLLRARRQRPCDRRAAEQRDELAASHVLPQPEGAAYHIAVGNAALCISAKLIVEWQKWVRSVELVPFATFSLHPHEPTFLGSGRVFLGEWQPELLLVPDEARQFRAVEWLELGAGFLKSLLQLRIVENLGQAVAKNTNDRLRRVRAVGERLPSNRGEAGNNGGCHRQVGKERRRFRRQDRKRGEVLRLDAAAQVAHPSITAWTRPPRISRIASAVPPVE